MLQQNSLLFVGRVSTLRRESSLVAQAERSSRAFQRDVRITAERSGQNVDHLFCRVQQTSTASAALIDDSGCLETPHGLVRRLTGYVQLGRQELDALS